VRKLVTYHVISLDGVATSPEQWVFDNFDADMVDHLHALIATQEAVVLGRVTYEGWATYWPTSTHEPFASFINTTQKHVASTSLHELTWDNSTLISGDLTEEITELKAQPGNDIGVHGSIRLTRALLHAHAVDEIRLAVLPVIVGSGRRLLADVGDLRRLTLANAQRTATGGMLLCYHPRTT